MRPYIALSTFGFYTNGHLDVQLSQLTVDDEQATDLVCIMIPLLVYNKNL